MSSAWNSACGKRAKSNHSGPRIARLTSPLFMSALVTLTVTSSFAPSGLSGSKSREARIEFLEHARRRVLLEAGDEIQAARPRIHLPIGGKRVRTHQETERDDPGRRQACLHVSGSMRSSTLSRLMK